MRCEQVRKRLAEYQLGALAEAEAEAVCAHLQECARCRAELAALQRLDALLAPAESVSAPPDLWARIQPRLRPRRALWWQPLLVPPRPAIATAAAVLMAAFGVWLALRGPTAPGPAPETLASSYQEHQIVAEWSQPFADDAALGAMFASLNGDGAEQ